LGARTLVKASLRRLGAAPAVWKAARLVWGPPGVIVLMYHRVGGDDVFDGIDVPRFRRQMSWLQRNCTVIAPEDLEARLERPDRVRPPVLLTFDDGYRDYHDRAFPILRELGLPALVFLSTAFMDEGGALWSDALRFAMLRTSRPQVELPWAPHEGHGLGTGPARRAAFRAALRHLKRLPDGERRERLGALFRALGYAEAGPVLDRQMMTWPEVEATRPLTRLGGHTHTHPILARVDAATQDREIATCRARIEDVCGVRPRWFAYPNGQPGDFTDETRAALRRHGFDLAFTASEGVNGPHAERLDLRRFSGRADVPQLAWFGRRSAAAPPAPGAR
jgi:peptidoglycan/xylan/chitin deacetylase (PgdA/CDA1 family)